MTEETLDATQIVPSERQRAWHRLGFYGFIHFTTNTFTGKEWGYGDESPSIFNPTELDCRQWARVASEVGMKGLILTCKHHDGFCLWPSAYTEHSVKNSPWKHGKGDVVRELSDACVEFGLKFGVYLSPWDRNHPDYGKPEYITYYRNQLRELLTNYGEVFEVWLDGANGGDGYYGGANETRRIDPSVYYDWDNTLMIVRELQPQAVVFSDAGPDVRWVGNESGEASLTNWCTLNAKGRYPGYCPNGYNPKFDLGKGHEGGTHWLPAEVDVSIRPGWFYHSEEDSKVRSALNLLDLYMKSYGRGSNLLLNLPPDQRGLIHENDVENLLAFAKLRDALFKNSVATVANPKTSFPETTIEIPLHGTVECNMIRILEDIQYGQSVKEWSLEVKSEGKWKRVASGTTIGAQRQVAFPTVICDAARICITNSLGTVNISEITLYKTPVITKEPVITRNHEGLVTIDKGNGAVIRYTTDSGEATMQSPIYENAFMLSSGGIVKAAVFKEDNPDALMAESSSVEKKFGIAKSKWSIHSCSSDQAINGEGAENCIDCNETTVWSSNTESPEHPHSISIDLGAKTPIKAFGYLPRQEGLWGMVNRCSFAISNDGENWTTIIEEVAFDNIAANPIMQIITLSETINARFFKFVSLGAVNNSPHGSVAELEVFTEI